MRFLLFISFILLTLQNANAIDFKNYTYEQSLQKAKDENKNILVTFTAMWCLPCEMMKNGLYNDENVNSEINNNWIAVSVEFDESSSYEWIQLFDVKCLPSHVLLDQNGNTLARAEGGMTKNQFLDFLIYKTIPSSPVYGNATSNMVDSPKSTLELSDNQIQNQQTNGKIILDGKLIDIDSNNKSESNAITSDSNTAPIVGSSDYVIQLGAFNNLEKIKLHQKTLNTKSKLQTLIIVDFNTEKLPYKLITKDRYSISEANLYASELKQKSIDCFVRTL